MLVLVLGSALREVCGDQEPLGLKFIEPAMTAPQYRLYSLDDRYAALVPDHEEGVAVSGELVEIAEDRWEELAATEPEGITPGPVELLDGRSVTAALGDHAYMEENATEITMYGGFLAYLRAVGKLPAAGASD